MNLYPNIQAKIKNLKRKVNKMQIDLITNRFMPNHLIDERFPEDISFGATGGPEYNTEIVVSAGGKEYRNMNWGNARAKYNVSHNIKTKEQIDKILSFFRSKKGRLIPFRFKDWSDYQANNCLIGIGDDLTTHFQLIKQYQGCNHLENRVITKPIAESVIIKINDKIMTSEKFKVDHNKGIVEFYTPPTAGHKIKADFEFDVLVRFDSDYLPITIESTDTYSTGEIHLIEVK